VRLNRLIPINRICDSGGGMNLRLCPVTPSVRNLLQPMHIGKGVCYDERSKYMHNSLSILNLHHWTVSTFEQG
jgi:hypothetical protein